MKRPDTATHDLFTPQSSIAAVKTKAAALARDDGMRRSVEHADVVSHAWSTLAYLHFRRYAERNETFLTEDVRDAALAAGVHEPPDPRAWGAVAMRAARAGLIERAGYAPAKSSNLSPKVLWRSKVLPHA